MDFLVVRLGTKELTTQEFLDKLTKIFDGYSVELIEINSILPVVVMDWWIGLSDKAPLKVLRETKMWRDLSKKTSYSTINMNYLLLEYWGKVIAMDGYKMALVYKSPQLELWVDTKDVRPR